jgi:hypothetical protein
MVQEVNKTYQGVKLIKLGVYFKFISLVNITSKAYLTVNTHCFNPWEVYRITDIENMHIWEAIH